MNSLFWSTPLRKALTITLVWRIIIAIAQMIAHYIMPRGHFDPFSLLSQEHWPANPLTLAIDGGVRSDSVWYAGIALHGYTYSTHHLSSIVFFPLYPLLIKLVSLVVGNAYVAGMLISNVCLFLAVPALHGWLKNRGMEDRTPLVMACLLCFPWSVFYSAMYTESLYLLLVLATFMWYERRRWGLAAAAMLLLTLCRPNAVVVVPCLLLILWREYRQVALAWLPILAAPLGLALFAGYQALRFGTPLATVHAQDVLPFGRSFSHALSDLQLHPRPGYPGWYLAIMLVVGLAALAMVPLVYRWLGGVYALYAALTVLMPATSALISMERFVMVAFPVFVAVAHIPWRKLLAAGLFAGFYISLFIAAAFSANWPVF